MKGATSIQERLWELRKDKGLNLEELSKLTGISKSALGSYEKEDFKEINHGNLITLADFYGVSVDYLLCRTENREQINTPLTELHLNDEMVALLKSGRINNRLLCELATHKDFIKFLADIEIYVDGIATMQIQNLNTLVDTVRHEIIERYRPGEDDPHLKVLQAAHISDDEYFSHMVLDDLSLIIRDIREAHKKDSESTPQTAVAWFVGFHVAAVRAVVIQLILYNSLFGKVFPLFISQILVYIHTFFNFSSNLSNCILDFAY